MSEKWYADGLRFSCTQCGNCCSGDPGYVWVDERELVTMAKHLQLELTEFLKQFVRQVGNRYSLVEHESGECVFLDPKTRGCTVYEVRPVQCRTWPFWSSNLQSETSWQETCRECPGAGTGKLYSLESIELARNERDL